MARPNVTEIGPNIARLREAVGLKQAELAGRLTMSAPSLSRVESGERLLAPEELQSLLASIGSEEALRFSEYLERDWHQLPVPPLNHADQDLLWEADQVCVSLRQLLDGDVKASFQKRIEEYLGQIQATSTLLLKRDHTVALIGPIGVGKSTAICKALGLEIHSDEGRTLTVLETGGGGITICEVHLYSGPGFGLIVEPCSEDEIRAHVMDFAELIWRSANRAVAVPNEDGDSRSISKEIQRAIRNLSDLQNRKTKAPDGGFDRVDDAKILAATCETPRDFAIQVLSRMKLHTRDARAVWHEAMSGKAPFAWLRETFLQINNGRHPGFSLPRRIEVVVSMSLVPNTDLNIRFIDTKGIDHTPNRPDLEAHLGDPHTLALLCTRFNNAPGTESLSLLTRAKEVGLRNLERHAAILALPQSREPLEMKDDATSEYAESPEEGCQLKREQVVAALDSTGNYGIPVAFFNAFEESRNSLVEFTLSRLLDARNAFRTELLGIISNVREVIKNQVKEQAQAVLREAASQLRHWVNKNKEAPKPTAKVEKSLITELRGAHPSTIHASVRREGHWPNLDYGYQLGHGARALATATLGKKIADFAAIAENLRTNPEFTEAEALIVQCEQVLRAAFDQLLRKMQLAGESLFTEDMKRDKNFWIACERLWGAGGGYRDKVTSKNVEWFDDGSHENVGVEVQQLLDQEWREALDRIDAMLQGI